MSKTHSYILAAGRSELEETPTICVLSQTLFQHKLAGAYNERFVGGRNDVCV
jgi:hypothetical protein